MFTFANRQTYCEFYCFNKHNYICQLNHLNTLITFGEIIGKTSGCNGQSQPCTYGRCHVGPSQQAKQDVLPDPNQDLQSQHREFKWNTILLRYSFGKSKTVVKKQNKCDQILTPVLNLCMILGKSFSLSVPNFLLSKWDNNGFFLHKSSGSNRPKMS